MVEAAIKRRLAAILAADVAGYTRLMQDDEAATVAALDAARLIFREQIEAEGGRVVDMAGDSVLAVFETVTGAVTTALAVQKAFAAIKSDTPDDRRMRFRIGVHLGDVMEKPDGSIYGDGVNLAARLEGLSAPGGVCISAAVSEQVSGKIEEVFEDIGEHSVKNVARPIHAFSWGGQPEAKTAPVPEKGRKPKVAIGAFQGIGGDEAMTLAAGVCDGVVAALSNQTGLAMVSNAARADYVVNASLQASEGRFRATFRILDRRADEHFAADQFDGTVTDPFQTQDDLAYRIFNMIHFAIYDRDAERTGALPLGEQSTQSLLTQARDLMFRGGFSSFAQSRSILEAVIAREPENFMALTMKAFTLLDQALCGYKPVAASDGAIALAAARKAVRLNEKSDFAHVNLSFIYLVCEGDIGAAQREAQRSIELNSYFSLAMHALGMVAMADGRPEEGLALLIKTFEASPRALDNSWVMQRIAQAQFTLGRYREAIEWAARSDQRQPEMPWSLMTLAASAAHLNDETAARQAGDRLMACCPDFRISDMGMWPFHNREPGERFLAGLRLAGLPE